MVYFDDLIMNGIHRLALEMAEVDQKHLKQEEANFLLNQMKLYYLKSKENDEKYNLLNCINKKPNGFKHMDLVKQVEKDNLKVEQFKL